ncbi:hypothetical protein SASPL_125313 [Salvia splendens]|uniref:Protein ABIL3 n=1 Tax=Salvia splendens TaxID=180675 RepID=A0A8X8XFA9_SALSN|nr:hypothetical protein SASPL_125313 [Salvia splendens]
METMTAAASMKFPREPANYDEISMQQSMLFSDSLKDLKNLRKQLYSAAEYFELSYTNDHQKHVVVNTLKDYAIKALVNTVDHLGSVTFKVNDLLDENIDEVSGTELRVSCLEQRLRTCHDYINREVGETMNGGLRAKSKYQGCSVDKGDEWHQFRSAIRATIQEAPPSIASKGRSSSPTPRFVQQPGNFAFSKSMPKKDLERRTVSPHRFPLLRSGSLSSKPTAPKSSRPTTPNQSRPTTPNLSSGRQPFISDPRKSASMRIRVGKESPKEFEQIPSKSKRLLKALLSRRKSKKDDTLYTYLDEY